MTWKSTAAAGVATIAATWLASHAPVGGPAPSRTTPISVDRTEAAAATIQREADRLHARLSEVGAYRDPARNPFRFKPRTPEPARRALRAEPAATIEETALDPRLPAPRMTLAGIAETIVGDETVRTAIISTPEDVWLVKVGDAVGQQFTVASIGADSVDLVPVDSGASLRLVLRP